MNIQKMQNYAQICTFEMLNKSLVPSTPKNVFTIYFAIGRTTRFYLLQIVR